MRNLTFVFILISNYFFCQDTLKIRKDIYIYKNNKIIQKEFYSSKNYIKIIYQYNEEGVIIHRFWYNRQGKLLGTTLE